MKSLIASILILGLVGMAVGVVVQGADTQSVNATVTVQSISLIVADGTVEYGTLAVNTNQTTIALADLQTVTNNGNVTETFNIRGTNSAAWTLAATNGNEQYKHESSNDLFVTSTVLTLANQVLAAGKAPGQTQTFHLKITTPTITTTFDQQSVNVIVQATL